MCNFAIIDCLNHELLNIRDEVHICILSDLNANDVEVIFKMIIYVYVYECMYVWCR